MSAPDRDREDSRSRSGTDRWRDAVVGPYELREELGRGAVGSVWRAWDSRGGREVAVKLLLSARGSGEQEEKRRKRILREGHTLARLRHPNVVTVHDVGEHQGVPYLVLELVLGETLEERLGRQGKLPLPEAARIGAQLARALAHAHAQEVLHRDVKPANVLLRAADGAVLLTDFGLALDLAADATRLSQAGAFLGTPQYWPPEQARGDLSRIGPWSDVYALGATLYHLVTGRAPHQGETFHELVQAAESAKTPVRTLRPEAHPELARLIERCLATDTAARPGMPELALELERLARRPTGGRRRHGRAWLLGAGALAVLTAATAALLLQRGALPRAAGGATATLAPTVPAPGPPPPTLPPPAPEEDPDALPEGWEALALDPALVADPARAPGLELFVPWCLAAEGGALRMTALGDERPELRLPLEFGSGPWRLRVRLAVACAEAGTAFVVALELPEDARVSAPPPRLFLAGGPTQDERMLFSAAVGEEVVLQMVPVAEPTGRPDVVLTMEYGGRNDPVLRFACVTGEGRVEKRLELGAALPAAEWHLRVGTGLFTRNAAQLSLISAALVRCELQAPRGSVRLAPPGDDWARVLGRLGRAYVRGELERVARSGADVAVKAAATQSATLFPATSFLGALATARLGREEEAATLFQSFQKAGALEQEMFERTSWYEELAARALLGLGAPERRALLRGWLELLPDREPLALRHLAEDQLRQARALRRYQPGQARAHYYKAAMAFQGLLPDLDPEGRRGLADAWLQLGCCADALALCERDPTPRGRMGMGWAAYRLGRWDVALAAMEAVPEAGLDSESLVVVQRVKASSRARARR